MKLREHIRILQLLENHASSKAGMRFILSLEEKLLLGKDKKKFTRQYSNQLIQDISPELIKAARMGREFNDFIIGKGK